jgi:hypothetical protein
MVWRPGMPDWKKAETVDDLKYLFEPKFQPPPIYERQNPPIEDKTPPNEQNQDKWNGILPMPKNWLIESIVLSVVCCSPVSMVGIYYALKVETRYSAIRQKIMKVL